MLGDGWGRMKGKLIVLSQKCVYNLKTETLIGIKCTWLNAQSYCPYGIASVVVSRMRINLSHAVIDNANNNMHK